MRSVLIILAGLTILGVLTLFGPHLGGGLSMVTAAQIFLAAWLVTALINVWIGVSREGYSVTDELPIFLATFAIPAAAAVLVWWTFS
jgi:hypothetical protein